MVLVPHLAREADDSLAVAGSLLELGRAGAAHVEVVLDGLQCAGAGCLVAGLLNRPKRSSRARTAAPGFDYGALSGEAGTSFVGRSSQQASRRERFPFPGAGIPSAETACAVEDTRHRDRVGVGLPARRVVELEKIQGTADAAAPAMAGDAAVTLAVVETDTQH